MNNKKIAGVFFIIGLVVIGFYFLYMALPFLISLTSNIVYLSGSLIFVIIALVAIYKLIKWFFN